MAFFDWNGNGKDDLFDNMMDYQIYMDINEENDDKYITDYALSENYGTSNAAAYKILGLDEIEGKNVQEM